MGKRFLYNNIPTIDYNLVMAYPAIEEFALATMYGLMPAPDVKPPLLASPPGKVGSHVTARFFVLSVKSTSAA